MYQIWRRPFPKMIDTADTLDEAERVLLDYELYAQDDGLAFKYWYEFVPDGTEETWYTT